MHVVALYIPDPNLPFFAITSEQIQTCDPNVLLLLRFIFVRTVAAILLRSDCLEVCHGAPGYVALLGALVGFASTVVTTDAMQPWKKEGDPPR